MLQSFYVSANHPTRNAIPGLGSTRMMQKPDHARIVWQNFTIELEYRMIETLFEWNIRGLYTVDYSRSD